MAIKAEREADARYAHIASELGMEGSLRLLYEARNAGLSASLALALRTQESGIKGDGNVWGHDAAPNGNTSGLGGKPVTRANYHVYLSHRGATGKGGMQGVGPLQLTYFTFQDEADRLGGCWVAKYNYRVGYQDLAHLIRMHSGNKHRALAEYNGGSRNPNFAYADSVLKHERFWHQKLT